MRVDKGNAPDHRPGKRMTGKQWDPPAARKRG